MIEMCVMYESIVCDLCCDCVLQGKPKVGVVTNDNRPMGFVFVDLTCHLNDLRDVINEQVNIFMSISFGFTFSKQTVLIIKL